MQVTTGVLLVLSFIQATLVALQVMTVLSVRTIDRERLSQQEKQPTEISRLVDDWPVALGSFILVFSGLLWMTSSVGAVPSAAVAITGITLVVLGATLG